MANPNFEALRRACENMRVPMTAPHPSSNLAEVDLQGRKFVFVNQTPPLNDHAQGQLCRDKDYFQSMAGSVIRMPCHEAFLNPDCAERFQDLVTHKSIAAIVDRISSQFALPCIVKRNGGARGSNVFKCASPDSVGNAVERIFDPHSKMHDFVALCQDFIDARVEYRCIFLDGRMELCYRKDNSAGSFSGNLSPLHFDGARAVVEQDADTISKLRSFCAPLFARIPLRYCGLDIVADQRGELWLLEANGSPGFEYFVRDCGYDPLVQLYENILSALR